MNIERNRLLNETFVTQCQDDVGRYRHCGPRPHWCWHLVRLEIFQEEKTSRDG